MTKPLGIAVVGPCTSGKSTLVANLKELGFNAWCVAQEHSDVKWLWKHKNPDFLVVLNVTLATARKRRNVSWDEHKLADQHKSLADARAHCNLYLPTDNLSPEQMVAKVVEAVNEDSAKRNQTSVS
jgi:deoxyadenosine/deoxycytidine kinase